MRLIEVKEFKRRILDSCFCADWVRVLVNRVIDDCPTVDAEPVTHAHWNKEDIGSSTIYHCSECKAVCWGGGRYCPHCGAKMDGDTDD